MGLLLVLAMLGAFCAGFVTCLIWMDRLDERRAREVDRLVREAADADPERGLGL